MSRWEQDEAEQEAYEKHMQAMYDEQCRMQQCAEEDAWLRAEVERLNAENDVLRGERAAVIAWLREGVAALSEPRLVSLEHLLSDMADAIERGEHRTEDYPLGFNVWEKKT